MGVVDAHIEMTSAVVSTRMIVIQRLHVFPKKPFWILQNSKWFSRIIVDRKKDKNMISLTCMALTHMVNKVSYSDFNICKTKKEHLYILKKNVQTGLLGPKCI